MKPSNNLENKTPSDTYWRIQAHSSLEPPLEYIQEVKVGYDLFNLLRSYKNVMQFQISSGRENRWKDTWVIKVRVLKKFSANNSALSDAEDNTSGLLNRGGVADLALLRTLLAIH